MTQKHAAWIEITFVTGYSVTDLFFLLLLYVQLYLRSFLTPKIKKNPLSILITLILYFLLLRINKEYQFRWLQTGLSE